MTDDQTPLKTPRFRIDRTGKGIAILMFVIVLILAIFAVARHIE